MASRTWKLGDTWVKVAWEELGEETRYRDIIEANPGYNPKKEPAPGTRIEILLEYTTLAIYLREQVNGRIRN
jgi:hypothetical protein